MGCLPYAIFVISLIALALQNVFTMEAIIAWSIIGLIIGMFFAKDPIAFWECARKGAASYGSTLMIMLYLIVGIYCALIRLGGAAEGLVWLGNALGLRGKPFVAFTFLATALFSTAAGTSFGALAAMSVSFYPAGIILGANPAYLLGALLSGAAFGDNLAPVSDTTILSAVSQNYRRKEGVAEVSGVVQSRLLYSLIPGAIAFVLYLFLGGPSELSVSAAQGQKILAEYSDPMGLVMFIPMIILMVIMILGRDVFIALTAGIVTTLAVGLSANRFTLKDVFYVEVAQPLSSASGALVTGVADVLSLIIFCVMIFSLTQVFEESGTMQAIIDKLTSRVGKSPKNVEVSIWGISTIVNLLTAGGPAFAVALLGPIADKVGSVAKIHPYRRANLVDAVSNSFGYFLPFGIMTLIGLSFAAAQTQAYPFLPVPSPGDLFFKVFHCWGLWIMMAIASFTGFGRTFEGEEGQVIKAWFSNEIPKEALD